MRVITITEKLDVPVEKAWMLFADLKNYPRYFKYVNRIYSKDEMNLHSEWYDFATFIVPVIVKHKVTVFEKEKQLGFDVDIPLTGYVKERMSFTENGGVTHIEATIEFHFGNKHFRLPIEEIFEKRMRESISGAIAKFKKEFKV
jgi:uncharacterized membrane protein